MSQSDYKTMALVQLADSVAHELNNIFTAVVGNLSLLNEQYGDQHPVVESVGEVLRTARRGMELSARLQAFAGRQQLRARSVNVARVVRSTIDALRQSLLRGVSVNVALTSADCIAIVDEEKLGMAVAELVSNSVAAMALPGNLSIDVSAVRFDDEDGIEDTVGLPTRSYVCIKVIDTGCGMPPDVAQRALDPLFTTKAANINAGWGLARVAGFVRQSQGQIIVDSKVGLGTRVEMYFPLGG
jgi:signal transduction histidine kinase